MHFLFILPSYVACTAVSAAEVKQHSGKFVVRLGCLARKRVIVAPTRVQNASRCWVEILECD